MTVVGVYDPFFQESKVDMLELCDQYIGSFEDLL